MINPNYLDTKKNWIRGTKLLEGNRYSLPLDFFSPILPVLATFWNVKIPIFFSIFQLPIFVRSVNLCSPMSGLDNSAKTRYQPIFWHCLGAVTISNDFLWKWALNPEIWAESSENSNKVGDLFDIEFFFFGNIRQFISNLNSSNTKYFYDWPISNSSNSPISNYFLTVRTKKEFTVCFEKKSVWKHCKITH